MITYCTNIHPGESWDDTLQNLQFHIPAVKSAVSPDEPFPVGLRLSCLAASQIDQSSSDHFVEWLQQNDLFVPTINGFPYGSFHATRVKEKVYLPDWRHPHRVEYTNRLADLLDTWLPENIRGSISTVPVGFRSCITEEQLGSVRENLISVLVHLDRLRQKSGKEIVLSLEPEPGCFLETTEDVVRFFERIRFPADLGRGIGICFDCCHQAVEFEDPASSLNLLAGAGITVAKVQVSSAPRLKNPDRATLEKFIEPCYLHQVVVKNNDGFIKRYDDLPEAVQQHVAGTADEWRIHFHVPVFAERTGICETTRAFIEEVLPLIDRKILLEVETYTWDVLPPELQSDTVSGSIIREIQWLKAQSDEANRSS